MRKMMILGCLILFLVAPMTWAQEKCEAPVWNIGDRWAYKNKSGYTGTNEVVRIEDEFYIIRAEGGREVFFEKNTFNQRFFIEPGVDERRKEVTHPRRKLYNFPIFVGKEWTDTTTALSTGGFKKVTYDSEFKVEGIEEVSTAAGVFTGYRIHYKETNTKRR